MVLLAAALELAIAAQGRPRQIAAEPFPETLAARSSRTSRDFEREAGTDSGRWQCAAPKSDCAAPNSVSKRAYDRYFENDQKHASVFAVCTVCLSDTARLQLRFLTYSASSRVVLLTARSFRAVPIEFRAQSLAGDEHLFFSAKDKRQAHQISRRVSSLRNGNENEGREVIDW